MHAPRLLWFVLLIPVVAGQAPTIDATVSSGGFVLDGEATFVVNGTFTCAAHDVDTEAVYTLSFETSHYTSGDASPEDIEITVPEPIVLEAPCFPEGPDQRVHAWSGTFTMVDIDGTPGATYHTDAMIEVGVDGRLGQTAPEGARVHTMGTIPEAEPVVEVDSPTVESPFLPWWIVLLLLRR